MELELGAKVALVAFFVMAFIAIIAAVVVVASVSGVETRDGEGERE